MNTPQIDWNLWRQRAITGLTHFLKGLKVVVAWLLVMLRKALHALVMWPTYRLPPQSRRPYVIGFIWSAMLISTLWTLPLLYFGIIVWPEWESNEDIYEVLETSDVPVTPSTACGPKCIADIRANRKLIEGIEENEVPYVLDRYNNEYVNSATWRKHVQGCLDHWDVFEKAERLTLYPAELLAGKAYIESLGCQFLGATNGDGGKGPMQITEVSPEELKDAATALGISVSELRYKENSPTGYLHNVVLGAYVLGAYENHLKSRGVGILAYNAGPGPGRHRTGAIGFMQRAGIKAPYTGHQISDFRGAIPDSLNKGARPKIYVDRVLASAVMVDRAHRGLPLVRLNSLTLKDIPGSDPSEDGAQFVRRP